MLPTHQITARTEIRGAVSAGSHGAAAVAAAGQPLHAGKDSGRGCGLIYQGIHAEYGWNGKGDKQPEKNDFP